MQQDERHGGISKRNHVRQSLHARSSSFIHTRKGEQACASSSFARQLSMLPFIWYLTLPAFRLISGFPAFRLSGFPVFRFSRPPTHVPPPASVDSGSQSYVLTHILPHAPDSRAQSPRPPSRAPIFRRPISGFSLPASVLQPSASPETPPFPRRARPCPHSQPAHAHHTPPPPAREGARARCERAKRATRAPCHRDVTGT